MTLFIYIHTLIFVYTYPPVILTFSFVHYLIDATSNLSIGCDYQQTLAALLFIVRWFDNVCAVDFISSLFYLVYLYNNKCTFFNPYALFLIYCGCYKISLMVLFKLKK